MTEEIIIDGVDISECGFTNACDKKMKCIILQDDVYETNPYCEGYNCYYKQLQRLKQENETYKRKNVELQITLNEFDRFNNYRKALEEIREICLKITNGDEYEKVIFADFCIAKAILKSINEVLG